MAKKIVVEVSRYLVHTAEVEVTGEELKALYDQGKTYQGTVDKVLDKTNPVELDRIGITLDQTDTLIVDPDSGAELYLSGGSS